MSDPYTILILTGSPSKTSRTASLAGLVEERLARAGFRTRTIHVRDLPAEALVHGNVEDPALQQAFSLVEQADGLVVASPTYKAAYTGILKAFLDLLPQFALRGKVVLPLLTGGSLAHVLALDYGLRPVLQSFEPKTTVTGLFLIDRAITRRDDGTASLDAEVLPRFESVTQNFVESVRALVTE